LFSHRVHRDLHRAHRRIFF